MENLRNSVQKYNEILTSMETTGVKKKLPQQRLKDNLQSELDSILVEKGNIVDRILHKEWKELPVIGILEIVRDCRQLETDTVHDCVLLGWSDAVYRSLLEILRVCVLCDSSQIAEIGNWCLENQKSWVFVVVTDRVRCCAIQFCMEVKDLELMQYYSIHYATEVLFVVKDMIKKGIHVIDLMKKVPSMVKACCSLFDPYVMGSEMCLRWDCDFLNLYGRVLRKEIYALIWKKERSDELMEWMEKNARNDNVIGVVEELYLHLTILLTEFLKTQEDYFTKWIKLMIQNRMLNKNEYTGAIEATSFSISLVQSNDMDNGLKVWHVFYDQLNVCGKTTMCNKLAKRVPTTKNLLAFIEKLVKKDQAKIAKRKRYALHREMLNKEAWTKLAHACANMSTVDNSKASIQWLHVFKNLIPTPRIRPRDVMILSKQCAILAECILSKMKVQDTYESTEMNNMILKLEIIKSILLQICNSHNGHFQHIATYFVDLLLSGSSPSTISSALLTEWKSNNTGNFTTQNDKNPLKASNVLLPCEIFPYQRRKLNRQEENSTISILSQVRGKCQSMRRTQSDTEKDQNNEVVSSEICSVHLSDILLTIVQDSPINRKSLAKLLVARLLPCIIQPSQDQYKEMLPLQSTFPTDLHIERWVLHAPGLLPILKDVCLCKEAFDMVLPVIKSILVFTIGRWHILGSRISKSTLKFPPYLSKEQLLKVSINLMECIANVLPHPLCNSCELFPFATNVQMKSLLLNMWNFLADEYGNANQSELPEKYVFPLKHTAHDHVYHVGQYYQRYLL